jgi:hypothetical protein
MPENEYAAQITAVHEAAHAVAAIRTGLIFDRVSSLPDDTGEVDGALYWDELHDELGLAMPPEALAVVLLAGACAEARLRGLRFDRVLSGEGALDDRASLSALGLTDAQFIAASRDVLALIDADWPFIERVAAQLVTGRSLDYDEVVALLEDDSGDCRIRAD